MHNLDAQNVYVLNLTPRLAGSLLSRGNIHQGAEGMGLFAKIKVAIK